MKRMVLAGALVVGLAAGFGAGGGSVRAAAQGPGKKMIYPETADPKASIAAGLAQAKREHKRVLIDFGGDWCGDCQVLDIYFHQKPNAELLSQHFVLVHVFVKESLDNNVELAAKYGVLLAKGVPALAVLDADGKVVYSQRTGQFNDMRHMDAGSVSMFLNRWKG